MRRGDPSRPDRHLRLRGGEQAFEASVGIGHPAPVFLDGGEPRLKAQAHRMVHVEDVSPEILVLERLGGLIEALVPDGVDAGKLFVRQHRDALIHVRHSFHPALDGELLARAVRLGEVTIDLLVDVKEGVEAPEFIIPRPGLEALVLHRVEGLVEFALEDPSRRIPFERESATLIAKKAHVEILKLRCEDRRAPASGLRAGRPQRDDRAEVVTAGQTAGSAIPVDGAATHRIGDGGH